MQVEDLNTLVIFIGLLFLSLVISVLLLVLYSNQRRQNVKNDERIKVLEGRVLVQLEDRVSSLEDDAIHAAKAHVKNTALES
ncbi:hypothetical protein ACE5JW_11580 [Acinetobacter radioresistens]|jgi:hypothetical protein|uniref:hypothetical protein n=1 Tax=Acinetobacter TaxID=469 RepID=UPI0002CF7FA9|nr:MULTISPECIES: hypothetical protein [Acinetobacter]ENV88179.1 hypothetical protein F940_00025 [Acinetobacter radioresistens NIPH 2130]EXB80136.1 hypothetical protein J538_3057 [Acinetobacter sp. 272263]MCK4078592.1 hypothetical protein [Acinetobacter radioresistens]MCK4084882.1 hypothetical protein [Acinetobacter radioresistens]MCK4087684.1 hypothetical protein [Acinetobacter radioresistens]